MKILSSYLFTWRRILTLTIIFAGGFILIQRLLRHTCEKWISFDCPYYFPISIFNFRYPDFQHLAVAAAVAFLFFLFIRYLESVRYRLVLSIAVGSALIAGTNFIQGTDAGFYAPIAGDYRSGVLVPNSTDGQEYYHDALLIADPVSFFQRYNEIQPTLNMHGHTHPPGAVLTFYVLEKLFRDPALISLVIMLISATLTAFFFYRLMRTEASEINARFMAFLILLVPAVQIYYLATLDALIAALLTGALYLFCYGKGQRSVAGTVFLLTASFLLTFVSLFILPVLAGFDLIVRRNLKRFFITAGGLIAAYAAIYLFTGYNALQSFRTASAYENPHGFMLLADPANYIFTRLEDVAEIIIFFGPFLLVLFLRGLKKMQNSPLFVLTALGCLTLLAMFLTGAWRTGETARACAFIYPYLLFPVGIYLEKTEAGENERLQLLMLVFVQSMAMQIFGYYHW